eukprot:CAMPEP_0172173332 /NCGR_PEP_ID=MMETSP1050-20130122/12989_1 /TAXON_ID=233186 /ORGANISM="Cryptomonas curvata, Strain CCAP979/52" /LENGTH=139 /DNA_ID=CAMNT_0012845063 /DNA_START=482 /DNA_END=897 /DNA_ORIENTATION=+
MEYCDRGDLAEHFKALRLNQHPYISEPVVRLWMEQLLQALEYLHSSGILHCDIKPHNVFMTSQGDLKLGDFGLATALARGKITSRVGTPSYIAPEVLQTDAYGRAMEMMTLQFLFERQGMLAAQALSLCLSLSLSLSLS